jgi:hypothetical protein
MLPPMADTFKPTGMKRGGEDFADPFAAFEEFDRNALAIGAEYNASRIHLSLESSETKPGLKWYRCVDDGRGMSHNTVLKKFMPFQASAGIRDHTLVNGGVFAM